MDILRRQVSAGGATSATADVTGARHYGNIRATAQHWLEELKFPPSRIDLSRQPPFSAAWAAFEGIARNLVTHPKLALMG